MRSIGGVRRSLKLGEPRFGRKIIMRQEGSGGASNWGNLWFPRFGQMAIIASIFIVIGLILLKNLLGIYSTLEEKRFQESNIVSKQMLNIKDEYKNIAGVSSMHGNASGIEYLYNFTDLIRNDMSASVLYLYVFSNSSAQSYSVTVGNFMNGMINATVNVTNSGSAGYLLGVIDDRKNSTTQFSFSASATVNMTLRYTINGANITEEFRVPVSTARNGIFGFFDITLETTGITVRSKEIYNKSWV